MADFHDVTELGIKVRIATVEVSLVRICHIGAKVVIIRPAYPSAIGELKIVFVPQVQRYVSTRKQVVVLSRIDVIRFFERCLHVRPLAPEPGLIRYTACFIAEYSIRSHNVFIVLEYVIKSRERFKHT
jgi:hypothetical protein